MFGGAAIISCIYRESGIEPSFSYLRVVKCSTIVLNMNFTVVSFIFIISIFNVTADYFEDTITFTAFTE